MPSLKRRSSSAKKSKKQTIQEFIRLNEKYKENATRAPKSQCGKLIMSIGDSYRDSQSMSMSFQEDNSCNRLPLGHHGDDWHDEIITPFGGSNNASLLGSIAEHEDDQGRRRPSNKSLTTDKKKWVKLPFSFR